MSIHRLQNVVLLGMDEDVDVGLVKEIALAVRVIFVHNLISMHTMNTF